MMKKSTKAKKGETIEEENERLKDNPFTLIASKLDKIYNSSGKQKGNYHGLQEMVKQLPEALENPLNIVQSTTDDNSIVVITHLSDQNDNIVIASVKIDGTGQVEIENVNKNIDSNVLTSIYGRENYDYQLKPRADGKFTGWMEENAKNDRIIYDIDGGIKKQRVEGKWVSFPNTNNSFSADNISQSNKNVKSDIPSTNNSTQNVQKNTKNSENDITWQEHLEKNYESTGTRTNLDTMEKVETQKDSKGRTLTKEQQEYFKDSKVRDENGNLKVLYHGIPFGEFNTFKGKHFFFSEDYKFAHDYSDSKSFEQGLDGETKVIEAYLKAEKVFDASNPDDIQKLRENLSNKIRYWGNSWDKETLLKKLQRKTTLEPKWKSEQIENKKFGDYIGDDRNGYNTDMFVGVNDKSEIVYIPQERGLQKLTDMEKSELEKNIDMVWKYNKSDIQIVFVSWEIYI